MQNGLTKTLSNQVFRKKPQIIVLKLTKFLRAHEIPDPHSGSALGKFKIDFLDLYEHFISNLQHNTITNQRIYT